MMEKVFKKVDLKAILVDWDEPDGCIATDRITVDGQRVGYMYREIPDSDTAFGKVDSGWRFFAGDEDDDYANNSDNLSLYTLNTICNYDPTIVPFLASPYNSAYFKNEEGIFEAEPFEVREE